MTDYAIVVVPLPEEEGGGFAAIYPDLPGCMSDGDTPEEAVENARDAQYAWMEVQKERGVIIPEPGTAAKHASRRVQNLLDALKSVIDYAEDAEAQIEYLEDTLAKAIEKLDGEWKVESNLLAITGSKKRFAALQ